MTFNFVPLFFACLVLRLASYLIKSINLDQMFCRPAILKQSKMLLWNLITVFQYWLNFFSVFAPPILNILVSQLHLAFFGFFWALFMMNGFCWSECSVKNPAVVITIASRWLSHKIIKTSSFAVKHSRVLLKWRYWTR